MTFNSGIDYKGVSVFWLLSLCIFHSWAETREESWQFRTYNRTNGLSQNTVNAVAQDQHGFLWIGTQYGVNRFDGYEFDNFTRPRSQQTKGLQNNYISALQVDDENNIWAATGAGLQYYSAWEKDFVALKSTHPGLENVLAESLALGKQNALWLGNQNGLFKVDIATKSVIEHRLPENLVSDILVTDEGLLVVINRDLLIRFTPQTNQQEVIYATSGTEIIHSILHTSDKKLLIGTSEKLIQISSEGPKVLFPNILKSALSLAQDKQNRVWIGTDSGVFFVVRILRQTVQPTSTKSKQRVLSQQTNQSDLRRPPSIGLVRHSVLRVSFTQPQIRVDIPPCIPARRSLFSEQQKYHGPNRNFREYSLARWSRRHCQNRLATR